VLVRVEGDSREVRVDVIDHGIGIPEEHLSKIFDPYFTTIQRGTGLGLATVYSIMQQHDGHITVASQPGAGTSITLYLPAAPAAQLASKTDDVVLPPGHGRILVMDDETIVREVVVEMLQALGYEAQAAVFFTD
jgi:hypothetical protein